MRRPARDFVGPVSPRICLRHGQNPAFLPHVLPQPCSGPEPVLAYPKNPLLQVHVLPLQSEVRHNLESAQCGAAHALYIVSAITVEHPDPPQCAGGFPLCLLPWNIDQAALSEIQYAYRVPGGPTP
jgi:hypothetical protein